MIDDIESFLYGILFVLIPALAFTLLLNVRAVPDGFEVAPIAVEEEYKLSCMDLFKEQVALERCEARYNCTLFPDDYRYGIQLADLREEMNCERKTIQSPEKALGDIQAGAGHP